MRRSHVHGFATVPLARYRMGVMRHSGSGDRRPAWPDRPALFLDLDGTLLDFADEPEGVEVSKRVRDLLGRLRDVTGGATALVSGRTMDDLDQLLAPQKFPLAGVHGLVLRDGAGRITRTEVNSEVLARIEGALRRFVKDNPETLLEHKGASLALHYRKRPELEASAIRQAEQTVAIVGSSMQVLYGNKVVEIKPQGQNKGSAIVCFMKDAPFNGRTPVFIGDDATDEDGFRTVNNLGGVSVKVNSGETAATSRLPDVDAVLKWLEELVSS